MKNFALTFDLILSANIGFSQFLTTGTVTTDNKYRSSGIGIGHSTLPTFGTNKFMVNYWCYCYGLQVAIGTVNVLSI